MVILVAFNSFNVVKNLKKPDPVARQVPPFYTTDNLNFFHHILEKVSKTNQLMGLIRRTFYVYRSTLTLLLKSLVTHQM